MHCSTLIISFRVILSFLCIYFIAANALAIEALEDNGDDDVCNNVDCGQGKCVPSNTSFQGIKGFDCACNHGWQKAELGPFTFPACTVPNCTLNFGCGNGAPPPPPPPALASLPPLLSLFNPCTFVWCGDGSCVVNGSGYYCKCNEGSANLFNLTGVACVKQCYLEADCVGVWLGPPVTPPPAPLASSGNMSGSAPSTSLPSVNGTSHGSNCSRSSRRINLLLFSLVLLLASV